MSTLTKILIVLLTISSIFLCGIVVTYVANADNYRQMYDDQIDELNSTKADAQNDRTLFKKESEKYARLEDKLRSEIASLTRKFGDLETTLKIVEAEKDDALRRVNSWAAIVMDFSKTTDEHTQLLKNTLAEKIRLEAEKEKNLKELNELATSLEQKMAVIVILDEKTKRLLEEKSELQDRLDKLLQPIGKRAVATTPVTPERAIARPARPIAEEISLKGSVTDVDLKNSVAEISIGSAQGVQKGMRFYVTRADEFICEIHIYYVDTDKSVGELKLVQKQPKAGDNISTNL